MAGGKVKKQLSSSCPDGDLSWEETHLPLTEDKILSVLNDPRLTFRHCDELYFSLLNGDATLFHKYSDAVMAKQAEIARK